MERSVALKLFTLIKESTKATCTLCGTEIERTLTMATTPLFTHLFKIHKIEKQVLENNLTWNCISDNLISDLSKKKSNPFLIAQNSLTKKKTITQLITKLIIQDFQSFSICEKDGFRNRPLA